MTWVLIVMTTVYGGNTVASVTFDQEAACVAARDDLRDLKGALGNPLARYAECYSRTTGRKPKQ